MVSDESAPCSSHRVSHINKQSESEESSTPPYEPKSGGKTHPPCRDGEGRPTHIVRDTLRQDEKSPPRRAVTHGSATCLFLPRHQLMIQRPGPAFVATRLRDTAAITDVSRRHGVP
ncbi:hypothetical protein GMDG_01969 [Pseudogymnoascus destructans 20631-21]|uniref:Uncharacterized protein n=1 Tax=Pseudogymnoascus destructans (strain ATCC MYA-4855 / 20631-21) TaxID=658429 RepID=L8FYM9_PSED2|nr:hypothetical protein GMDG_01969 [Pseudogymnoascus destructans 20631-21]